MSKYTSLIASMLIYIFLALTPLWISISDPIHWVSFYVTLWFVSDFIVSLFLHRWAAHRLWNPPRWVQYVLSYIGVVYLFSTPLSWAGVHRMHHAKSDTENDPHSPHFKSWVFIVLKYRYHNASFKKATDMMRDKYIMWLSKNELYVIVASHITLLYLLDPIWYMSIIAMPTAYSVLFMGLLVNVIPHTGTEIRNLPWAWPLIFSESWHRNHHNKPVLMCSKYEISGRIIKALKWT